jgi:hypothetical protein
MSSEAVVGATVSGDRSEMGPDRERRPGPSTRASDGFEQAQAATDHAVGWDRQVLEVLLGRIADEESALRAYGDELGVRKQPGIRYVVDLLRQEGERHHAWLVATANSLAEHVSGVASGPTVPRLAYQSHDGVSIEAFTRRMIAAERRDRASLRIPIWKLRPVSDTTLWSFLVDWMIEDTRKHIRMLRSLRRLARAAG